MSVFPFKPHRTVQRPAFRDRPVLFEGKCALICPGCGGSCLHHVEIVAYDRHEDDQRALRTVINNGDVQLRVIENNSSNPSSRRDGIVIKLYCETCDCSPELTIAQHKGQTLVDWR